MAHPKVRVSLRELANSVAEINTVHDTPSSGHGRVNAEQAMAVLGNLGALLRAADTRQAFLIFASLIDQAGTHTGESPYRAELRERRAS